MAIQRVSLLAIRTKPLSLGYFLSISSTILTHIEYGEGFNLMPTPNNFQRPTASLSSRSQQQRNFETVAKNQINPSQIREMTISDLPLFLALPQSTQKDMVFGILYRHHATVVSFHVYTLVGLFMVGQLIW